LVRKSTEELLSEYLKYPVEEFMPLWSHDARATIFSIDQAAKVLNLLLDNDEFDREQARKILQIIQNSTSGLGSIIDATVEYHKRQGGT
jgi:hypothetical protein